MGLLEFNKPQWLHKDAARRLEAVNSLDPGESGILSSLAGEDQDAGVRRAAINRLTDPALLDTLSANTSFPEDLSLIISRKEQALYELVLASPDHVPALEYLAAISSRELLAEIAATAEQTSIRLAAISRIDDQPLLAGILERKCGKDPARAALAKILDEELLVRLANTATSKTARRLAAEKLAEIEQQKSRPDPAEIRDQALRDLAAETEQLPPGGNWDGGAARLAAIKEEWRELDPGGIHPSHPGFVESCASFAMRFRDILEIRQAEQDKAARYETQLARLNEICLTIEGLTGSTAPEAQALKNQATRDWEVLLDAPGNLVVPSAALKNRFAKACRSFDKTMEKIVREQAFVDLVNEKFTETTSQINSGNYKQAAALLREVKKALTEIRLKYFNSAAIRKQIREMGIELIDAENNASKTNLVRRRQICSELQSLCSAENPAQSDRQVQLLRHEWAQLPPILDREGQELELLFQKALDDFTAKQEAFQHDQDWQLWADLSLKEKLVGKVSALDQEDNLERVFTVIKEAQAEWKKIGPVPQRKARKLWEKFHGACNRNFERTAPYLEELKNRREEAMARRREICRLAEELVETADWQKTAATLKDLQLEWKNLLHGSRREEDRLFKRFRQACDLFFERRQQNYATKEEERARNLLAKEKLCAEAERLAADHRPEHASEFRTLQANWKKIGPVAKDQEKAMWSRFRQACDAFFNRLDEERRQNLSSKEALCEAVEKLLAEATADSAPSEVAARLTELQQQWRETGPVPHDRQEAVRQRFNSACDSFSKARRQRFEKEEQERRRNQTRKAALLARAEELARRNSNPKTTEMLQAIQKEWQESGPAPRETDRELDDRFQKACTAFFEGRHHYFIELEQRYLENLKKKESLCLRLENLLGTAGESVAKGRDKALSLAEELKQAMEDNFMLAGRRHDQKTISDEVGRIEKEWKKIGPVVPKEEQRLTERFRKGLAEFAQGRQKSTTPPRKERKSRKS